MKVTTTQSKTVSFDECEALTQRSIWNAPSSTEANACAQNYPDHFQADYQRYGKREKIWSVEYTWGYWAGFTQKPSVKK